MNYRDFPPAATGLAKWGAFGYGLYMNACADALNASGGAGSVLVPGGRLEFEVDLGFGSDGPVLSLPSDL